MYCRNCGKEMNNNAAVCVSCGAGKGTGNQYCQNCGIQVNPNATFCTSCGCSLSGNAAAGANGKSKLVAGLLAILLGALGIHNFYLGYTKKAVIQLLVTVIGAFLTFGLSAIVMEVWAIVEGIQIFTGKIATDAKGEPLQD